MPREILKEKLQKMLEEDIGQGDITTELVVSEESTGVAEVIVKEFGVVAGIEEARILLGSLGLKAEALVTDGEKVRPKQTLVKITGCTRTILSAERTLLNILSRMSGIATITRKLVEKLQENKLKTRVACTRKTAPGLLYFDKKAVLIGGGDTHRLHLDDMILVKDNHIIVAGSIHKAIKRAREQASFSKKIEVEVAKIDDALVAAQTGVDIIMLDNLSPTKIKKAIKLLKEKEHFGKILVEASGGITKRNILAFASTGVDIVSLGEITDSPKALDISLKLTKITKN